MTRRRWGKAGQRLTPQEAAEIDRRRQAKQESRAAALNKAYRQWANGQVVPHRITVALDAHGLFGPEVDEACGATEPDVDRWEAGTKYPTWDQLVKLAELTGVTPGFFMQPPSALETLKTSMRFHRIGGQRCDTTEPPPVRHFTPDAITEATGRNYP